MRWIHQRISVARGEFRREGFTGTGCVKSNRPAIILGCMIPKEDFVVETSVDESKQLATIIDRMKLYV